MPPDWLFDARGKSKCQRQYLVLHAKKEIVALYKEIVEGTISDGWI